MKEALTNDLVAKLRERGKADLLDGYEDKTDRGMLDFEAVNLIESLRAELDERNERLLLLYETLTGQPRSTWPHAVGSGT